MAGRRTKGATMDLILLMILAFIVMIPFAVILFIAVRNASFRNKAWIARQTGQSIDDVVWIPDKFKVQYVDGKWEIRFKKMKDKTQSVDGKLWTKVIKDKSVTKILSYTKQEWLNLNMQQHIMRGIFFYETTEGEFFPMTIKSDKEGNAIFSLVNQDNRDFVIRETQNANDLTKSKKADYKVLIAIIVGIIVLGIVFGAGGYWQAKQHEQTVTETTTLGMEYAKAVYNITCGNTPQFIGNIPRPPGG